MEERLYLFQKTGTAYGLNQAGSTAAAQIVDTAPKLFILGFSVQLTLHFQLDVLSGKS